MADRYKLQLIEQDKKISNNNMYKIKDEDMVELLLAKNIIKNKNKVKILYHAVQ